MAREVQEISEGALKVEWALALTRPTGLGGFGRRTLSLGIYARVRRSRAARRIRAELWTANRAAGPYRRAKFEGVPPFDLGVAQTARRGKIIYLPGERSTAFRLPSDAFVDVRAVGRVTELDHECRSLEAPR
jgi:hypothetical protein